MLGFPALNVNGNSSSKLFEQRGCNQFNSRGMSRRFSNLQYISIGILFGTCVFLWTRKLNLTKSFDESNAASNNLRQTARNENEERLINSWANKIETEDMPSNFEDGEEAINGPENNTNGHIGSKEADFDVKEAFMINSPKISEEPEQVADIDSSHTSPHEPAVNSPESEGANVSDAPLPAIENEDISSTPVGTSDALSLPISTTTRTK